MRTRDTRTASGVGFSYSQRQPCARRDILSSLYIFTSPHLRIFASPHLRISSPSQPQTRTTASDRCSIGPALTLPPGRAGTKQDGRPSDDHAVPLLHRHCTSSCLRPANKEDSFATASRGGTSQRVWLRQSGQLQRTRRTRARSWD